MAVVLFAKTCFPSASHLVILASNKAETQETTIQDIREQQYDDEERDVDVTDGYDNEM